jgi:pyruvate dehydrogenase (quinone)
MPNSFRDSTETLRALLPLLEQKSDRSWRKEVEENVAAWWTEMDDRAHATANPINPQLVTWELSPRLPEHAIVTVIPALAPIGMRATSRSGVA